MEQPYTKNSTSTRNDIAGNARHNSDNYLGSEMANKGQEVVDKVSSAAKTFGTELAERTDNALSSVGEGMSSISDSIKRTVAPNSTIASTATAVAERIDAGGRYLQDHGVDQVATDMTNVIRRNPIQSLWVGIGVGVLIGSVLNRK